MKHIPTLLLSALLLYIACSQKAAEGDKAPALTSETAINLTSVPVSLVTEHQIKDTSLISASTKDVPSKGKILTEGFFHDDEVWPGAAQEKWYGLFKGRNGYYLQQTTIKTTRSHDPLVDDNESIKSGWEVSSPSQDSSVVVISGLPAICNRAVEAVALAKTEILPGEKVSLTFKGASYVLYATGKNEQESPASDWFIVSDYKLYLTANKNGQKITQLLIDEKYFDDDMINILFVGGLDGDTVPDFLIDTSNHYNAITPTLFLSSPALKEQILKLVANHTSVGC